MTGMEKGWSWAGTCRGCMRGACSLAKVLAEQTVHCQQPQKTHSQRNLRVKKEYMQNPVILLEDVFQRRCGLGVELRWRRTGYWYGDR
jgi:hypothetical protein